MTLIATHLSFLETPLSQALEAYNTHVVPRLTKKNKVIAISTAVALSAYILMDKYFKPPRKLRHIPYINFYQFLKGVYNRYSYVTKATKLYLPIVNSPENNGIYMTLERLGWVVHVANPQDAKLVLMKYDKFPKADLKIGVETTLNAKFAPDNIAVINGAHWKSQRMLANPAFRRSMPVKLFGSLTMDLFKLIDGAGETVEITDLMERFTLDAIGNAGFGFDFKAIREKDNDWVNTYNTVSKGMGDPFFFLLPIFDTKLLWLFPKRQAVHKEMSRFLKMMDQIIVQKREAIASGRNQNDALEENEKDLLTLMIEAEAKGEGVMSNQDLKSNLNVFFLAGHDTTANTLSAAFYYLAKNPDVQQKAREEVLAILGDALEDVIPSVEQTKEMTYINQIIKETLRINGPAPTVVPRTATEDLNLSGTFIPKGSLITVDLYNLHHSDKIWNDGFEFNPDRFSDHGESSSQGEGFSWVPFGSGPRQCIGMNFSLAEQRVILSMFLRKYTWSLPEDSIHKDSLSMRGITVIGPQKIDLSFKKRY